jgi:deoxyadenosine/deoxycytidine kinase
MERMKNFAYIGFEGPIGAGKTTLTHLLAAHIGASIILEDVDGNEFLSDFYKDRERWSLAMQLWFLAARHKQLGAIPSVRNNFVVADYTYAKDAIFAKTLLRSREFRLYKEISAGLTATATQTSLTVYLDADDEVLIERIRLRGRPYETSITSEYLDSVRNGYEEYLASASGLNVFRFDTSQLNLGSKAELVSLYEMILERARDSK